MRYIAVFAAVAFAALLVVLAQVSPSYAAQATVAMSNTGMAVDTVVGTGSTVPAQLVMRGHGGGSRSGAFRSSGFRSGAFRSSGFRSFHANRFNRFNRVHFRPHRFVRPFIYGSVAVPYYYSSYYNDCYWDGYRWVCPDDYLY